MDEKALYIIEYYYDIKARLWRADVIDEETNVVDYVNAYTESEIKSEAEDLKQKYQVLRVTKTSFYKYK